MESVGARAPKVAVSSRSTAWEAMKALKEGMDWLGVTDEQGSLIGRVSRKRIMAELIKG
jgi:hypothetical protein